MSALSTTLIALGGLVALVLSGLRWLRVAQREHYLPGSTTRFAVRWWSTSPLNIAAFSLATVGAVVSLWLAVVAIVPVAIVAFGPSGLSVRGRTSQLAWTRRLRSLAVVATVFELIVVGSLSLVSTAAAVAIGALLVPVAVDLAAAILAPFEERAGRRFVDQATARLGRVAPRIVGDHRLVWEDLGQEPPRRPDQRGSRRRAVSSVLQQSSRAGAGDQRAPGRGH